MNISWHDCVIVTIVIEILILIYILVRNNWVYTQRIKLIDEDFCKYKQLPEYDEMLIGHGFWKWDINYYLKDLSDG